MKSWCQSDIYADIKWVALKFISSLSSNEVVKMRILHLFAILSFTFKSARTFDIIEFQTKLPGKPQIDYVKSFLWCFSQAINRTILTLV